MTASNAGRSAVDSCLAGLGKFREHWMTVTFALGALFWLRDEWMALSRLPADVAAQEERVAVLALRVADLDGRLSAAIGLQPGATPRTVRACATPHLVVLCTRSD